MPRLPHDQRILSIQSHVAFGYVGGKAAVFPLQTLGYDVDVVNTVNFSNHAAYHRAGGNKATAQDLQAIFDAMDQNELLAPTHLLTGYTANAESLEVVYHLAVKLRDRNPDLIYLLDPVLGDAGRLYVAPDCIPVYRNMLPLATLITPNWFELETLSDTSLKNITSLQSALRILHHTYHVLNVVISSIPLSPWLRQALPPYLHPQGATTLDGNESSYIVCITSTATEGGPNPSIIQALALSTVPGYFTGVGDLFSALVLGHYHPSPSAESAAQSGNSSTPLSHAVSLALYKTQSLIRLTHEHAMSLPEDERYPTDDEKDEADMIRKRRRMRGRELRIVQGQDVLRHKQVDDPTKWEMKVWDEFWS